MGPTRNKRTYSKAITIVSETAEERRKRYKTRKNPPCFDQLFLNGNENKPKTPHNSKKGKNAKSGTTIFEDSLADFQLPPPSTRKPLATKNVDNTSHGTSSQSSCSSLNENDTFDKLFKKTSKLTVKHQNKACISQAPSVATKPNNSKSTSNSSISCSNSSEMNDLLFCSQLLQGASGEMSAQNISSLMQKNRKIVKQRKQVISNPPAKENTASPDLFDSMKHQSEDSPCSSVPSSPVPQRRTTRTAQSKRWSRDDLDARRARTTATNRRNATRKTCQATDLRAAVIPKKQIPRDRKSIKVAVNDLEVNWTDEIEHKVLVADWTESDENAAQIQKEPKKKIYRSRVKGKVSIQNVEDKDNKVTFVEENKNIHEDNLKMQNISPALHRSVKRLTVQTPEENVGLSVLNSQASHNSLSDVITSTPANQTTSRRIPSNGTPWGLQLDPMLEDTTLSPVQRDSCIQAAFERSSIFESPMTFKPKCRGSTASNSGISPSYTTANEDPGIKTRTINDTEQRFSLGNENRDEMIPVFDPEARVSSQFKRSKSSIEHCKSQSRELRKSKKSEMKRQSLKQKHVSIKEDGMESELDASIFNDNENCLQENSLSNSFKTMDSIERSLSLMQISLTEIIKNYSGKRRRGTIGKQITDHETTGELIKLGVLGTRTSLRLEAKIARQSTSNSPFKGPPSAMKTRRSRKQVEEVKKMIESLSLSKTETSNLSIVKNKCNELSLVHPNQHSSLGPCLTDRSPVVQMQTLLRRSRRRTGDKKQINISTDQEISRIITRPTRKRSSRNKKNISTDMEQSYSFIANGPMNHTSNNQTSSNLPTMKTLKRKTNSDKERSSIILSSILGKSTVNKEECNVSSYSTRSRRTDKSMDKMQSTLDDSSVLSTFTRQGRKRADKVVFTKPDTSVSDNSVMSMGDSVIDIQSVNELPVIKENSNNLETDSSSNTSDEISESDYTISDKVSIEDVSSEESEKVVDNEDVEENYYEEHEVSENEVSDKSECSEYSDVPAEVEGEEVTEDEIEENEAISIDESVFSIEKDDVFLYVENKSSISTHVRSYNFSGVIDKNTSYVNKNSSVLEKSNINSKSKVEISISDPIEVTEKLEELNLDKQDVSMFDVDNSYNKSVSMIEVENISKQKTNSVLEKKETSNIQSASMLELDDAFDNLPFLKAGVKIPAKPGKGWRRSLNANLLASFNESITLGNNEQIDSRRQTIHRISGSKINDAVVKISRLPVEFENKFHRRSSMVPLTPVSRLSQRKCSYYCVRKSSIDVPSDPREHVLQLCSQREPLPLSDCFTQSRLSCCKKIGEGVYGEVFMSRLNPNSMEGATVLKIMPIEGDFEINGERQKKFHEILSEIVISVELSNLRLASKTKNWCETYVNVLKCWCLEGQYLPELLTFWDNFDAEKGSENDRPELFPTNQLYIVLEFSHGGTDLEGYVFNNAAQSLAVFRQIVMSLAVAEQELEFEHRDLHWGNVLVAPTKDTTITFKVDGQDYTLNTQGVRATIIDFTLSRLNAPHCVVYNNLGEDPDLFVAEGDYQFEIYRQMKKTNNNNWESFNPYTNVLWLHYVLDKMINECYYKNIKTKVHKTNHATLSRIKNKMLQYKSATDYVQNE